MKLCLIGVGIQLLDSSCLHFIATRQTFGPNVLRRNTFGQSRKKSSSHLRFTSVNYKLSNANHKSRLHLECRASKKLSLPHLNTVISDMMDGVLLQLIN